MRFLVILLTGWSSHDNVPLLDYVMVSDDMDVDAECKSWKEANKETPSRTSFSQWLVKKGARYASPQDIPLYNVETETWHAVTLE